tara:strand:+ start:537 stop:1784 length:1248 start_codon:yes stop_codon:yes gene_type:complete
MILSLRYFCKTFLISFILFGCVNQDEIIGTRINVLNDINNNNRHVPLTIPEMEKSNTAGVAQNNTLNYFLSPQPKKSWILDLNLGKSIATPLIHKNNLIILDATGDLRSFDLDTKKALWNYSVLPTGTSNDQLIGGGITVDDGGLLYVTTSAGEVLSISMKKGTLNWRYKVDAPILAAPTIFNGNIFFTDSSNISHALSADSELIWTFFGVPYDQIRARTGKPIPAGDLLLLASSSGILSAVDRKTGEKKWDFKFNVFRAGHTQNTFGSFNGDPLVQGDVIFFGSVNGQFNSFRTNGEVVWQVPIGLQGSPLLVSNSLFLISDTNELIRLNKDNGSLIWSIKLGGSNDLNSYFTPVLAGSKLWVSSSDGHLTSFDPLTGDLVDQLLISSGLSSSPMYHSGRLLLISNNGSLRAVE